MEKKQRIAWLDYVRFLSIFLVILFHTPPRCPLVDDAVILNMRIPVFFCISGFLYSIDKYPSFLRYFLHRAKQILIPYTTFFMVFYALWLCVGRGMVGASEQAIDVTKPIVEFFEGDPKVVVAPFWYIACLFTIQMLYYWIERIFPRRWVFVVCVLLLLVAWHLPYVKYWNFSNCLIYMPFYAFGNRFKGYVGSVNFSSGRRTVLLCAMAVLSMVMMALVEGHRQYEFYNIVMLVAGLMLLPAYVSFGKLLADRLGNCRVVEFVVMSGTVYLGLQNYFIGFTKIVLNHVFYDGVLDDNAWLRIIIALAVMAAIYPFAWVIDHYIPWFIGKGKYLDKI